RVAAIATERARHIAEPRRQRLEYWIEAVDDGFGPANHHAVAALQAPDAASEITSYYEAARGRTTLANPRKHARSPRIWETRDHRKMLCAASHALPSFLPGPCSFCPPNAVRGQTNMTPAT